MTSFESVILEVPDPAAADVFYEAFGLGPYVDVRASDAPTTGFRGFALSLVASQPGNVDALVGAALDAGATTLKPATKSFWGYGGVVRAPDGTICKIATSNKKDTGPAARHIDQVALLLGVADVKASRRFYCQELRRQVRRVRHPGVARHAGPLSAPRPRQGHRCLPGGRRIASDRDRRRCRAVHRPRRVRLGGRVRLTVRAGRRARPGGHDEAASPYSRLWAGSSPPAGRTATRRSDPRGVRPGGRSG